MIRIDSSSLKFLRPQYLVLTSFLCGVFIFAITHFSGMSVSTDTDHVSLFFGNMKSWPAYVRNDFWPLDLLIIWLATGLACWLTAAWVRNQHRENVLLRPKQWFQFVIGIAAVFGCFGALGTAGIFGWYSGLEAFVVFYLLCLAIVVVTCCLVAAGQLLFVLARVLRRMLARTS